MLLDGEGTIFKDEHLQLGEEGGQNAAKLLDTALRSYLTQNFPNISEPKLLTKVYLNVKAFGELCARSGILSEAAMIHEFIRGFNETMSFSEVVDIGSGKNKAYDKIQGSCGAMSYSTGKPRLIIFPCNRDLPSFPVQLPLPPDLPGLPLK